SRRRHRRCPSGSRRAGPDAVAPASWPWPPRPESPHRFAWAAGAAAPAPWAHRRRNGGPARSDREGRTSTSSDVLGLEIDLAIAQIETQAVHGHRLDEGHDGRLVLDDARAR